MSLDISYGPRPKKKKAGRPTYYVGVDGEGYTPVLDGKQTGRHRYTLLAWSDEWQDKHDYIEDYNGLTTRACLDFLLAMPNPARAFAYAFNYDMTKILVDVDNETLYRLFRPDLRKPPKDSPAHEPVKVPWVAPPAGVEPEKLYYLNLQGTKLTVHDPLTKRKRVIWDVFKFFQARFVSALVDWKVATKDELKAMSVMKDKRSTFDSNHKAEIRRYCLDECCKMAKLAEKLVTAHEDAGLELKTFFGAGSTGGAMLKKMNIHKEKRVALPEMTEAVACGFFGGRFENSVIGPVEGPLWSYDISSAYPYETTFLPCLSCGKWRLTQRREDLETARCALVRYSLGPAPKDDPLFSSWGPFPFRTRDGYICYPTESGGGWIWDKEYKEGERMYSNVRFEEAWIYEAGCNHQPFRNVPEYYLLRLKIGKEGKGLVIKLGVNSVYGKLAQSMGDDPPFQCWPWAGMITSGTRAQILRALSLHKDPRNLLMTATDGICSRERLLLPTPRETETGVALPDKEGKMVSKPLGGWEEKEIPKGVFFVRPGIYFPQNPTEEELDKIRARGVGRGVMYKAWPSLVEAYERGESMIKLAEVSRFVGAKSSISVGGVKAGRLAFKRAPNYGEWIQRPVELTFDPFPKRSHVRQDKTLEVWKFPCDKFPREMSSIPYKNAMPKRAGMTSLEAILLREAQEQALEQPGGGDYEAALDYEALEYVDEAMYLET